MDVLRKLLLPSVRPFIFESYESVLPQISCRNPKEADDLFFFTNTTLDIIKDLKKLSGLRSTIVELE